MNSTRCTLCPHHCTLPEGGSGFCGVRTNQKGRIQSETYGLVSGVALDPIEKKPLYHFHPGAQILSVGGFGCNMRCPFCQNHNIASPPPNPAPFHARGGKRLPPEQLALLAQKYAPQGNIGVAYTYNEPLINYEYVLDCAKAVSNLSMKNVLVTNSLLNPKPFENLLPYIHAMNIDLKGFSEEFYSKLTYGGTLPETEPPRDFPALATVKNTITQAQRHCHIEVTTLVIPGENEAHIEPIAQWLAQLSPEIPYHLSRFFPRHNYADKAPTPKETLLRLAKAARKHLQYVYIGNV
ncbi:MAG: AmmeMemoRadiSam system radical SAM enzyme [Defluviitaleaceae bacterium]|nr:AmmeMemoRadiSam system radical SAM enzyme [Defluviitaleaceae bacterium]MCL2239769.1 AmmeMemoRadiSam system radical SAM enzyme [Defluviitaleaceae bacterium]